MFDFRQSVHHFRVVDSGENGSGEGRRVNFSNQTKSVVIHSDCSQDSDSFVGFIFSIPQRQRGGKTVPILPQNKIDAVGNQR